VAALAKEVGWAGGQHKWQAMIFLISWGGYFYDKVYLLQPRRKKDGQMLERNVWADGHPNELS